MPNAPRLLHGYNGEAYYQPSLDTVHLPDAETFLSPEFYYATCFHELAHSTGHSTRLNRNIQNAFGTKDYAREELIAEMSAAILCNQVGIESTIDNSASYISGWLRRLQNDHYLVIWAAGRASKAVQYILNVQEVE
jgi:antirestriction protein ArdC